MLNENYSADEVRLLYENENTTPYAYLFDFGTEGKHQFYMLYLMTTRKAAEADMTGEITGTTRYSAFPLEYNGSGYFVLATEIPCYTMPENLSDGAGGTWAGEFNTSAGSTTFVYQWKTDGRIRYLAETCDEDGNTLSDVDYTYTLDSSRSDGYVYCFTDSDDADAQDLYLIYINGNLYNIASF